MSCNLSLSLSFYIKLLIIKYSFEIFSIIPLNNSFLFYFLFISIIPLNNSFNLRPSILIIPINISVGNYEENNQFIDWDNFESFFIIAEEIIILNNDYSIIIDVTKWVTLLLDDKKKEMII